jgi:hypothetical protein
LATRVSGSGLGDVDKTRFLLTITPVVAATASSGEFEELALNVESTELELACGISVDGINLGNGGVTWGSKNSRDGGEAEKT